MDDLAKRRTELVNHLLRLFDLLDYLLSGGGAVHGRTDVFLVDAELGDLDDAGRPDECGCLAKD